MLIDPSITVIVRHSPDCNQTSETFKDCGCWKSARVYNPNQVAITFAGKPIPARGRKKIKTKTRAWEKAAKWVTTNLQAFHDDNDPILQET